MFDNLLPKTIAIISYVNFSSMLLRPDGLEFEARREYGPVKGGPSAGAVVNHTSRQEMDNPSFTL